MKVCVFSSPRTLSMLIPNLLERYLGLTNYRETFAYPKRVYEVDYHRLMRLVDNDNYVVKITPSSFHHGTFLRPDIFPWLAFDKIIILNRKNIVEHDAIDAAKPIEQEEVEFDHSHISGGLSKIQTADNVFGIFTSRAMRERGRYQLQLMKTRSSSGVGQKIDLEFNIETLRISDLPEDQQELESQTRSNQIINQIKSRSSTVVDQDGVIDPNRGASLAPAPKAIVESTKLKQFINNLTQDEE